MVDRLSEGNALVADEAGSRRLAHPTFDPHRAAQLADAKRNVKRPSGAEGTGTCAPCAAVRQFLVFTQGAFTVNTDRIERELATWHAERHEGGRK